MDKIKLFTENEKELETTNNKYIQSGYRDEIYIRKFLVSVNIIIINPRERDMKHQQLCVA